MSEWVPVSEKLPKLGETVLFYDSVSKCWFKGGLQRIGIEGKHQWNPSDRGKGYYGDTFDHVTHWMIPEAPEAL